MRHSATGVGLTPELARLARSSPTAVKQMIEALQIKQAAVRQNRDQFLTCDSTAGKLFTGDLPLHPGEDGVRLLDTVQTLIPEHAPHNSYFRDPFLAGSARFPSICDVVEWAGAEPAEIEIKSVKRWLHPRLDPAQWPGDPPGSNAAVRWRLDLLHVVRVGWPMGFPAHRQLFCAPIAEPIYADVGGSSEGLVTFDYSSTAVLTRPKPKQYGRPAFADPLLATLFQAPPAPTTLLFFTALDKYGAPASNVGAGYDSTVQSVTTAGGNVLSSRSIVAP